MGRSVSGPGGGSSGRVHGRCTSAARSRPAVTPAPVPEARPGLGWESRRRSRRQGAGGASLDKAVAGGVASGALLQLREDLLQETVLPLDETKALRSCSQSSVEARSGASVPYSSAAERNPTGSSSRPSPAAPAPRSGIDTSDYHDILNRMFQRTLRLPPPGTETFFLWGPRQTGKSTLLRRSYPDATWVDLLKADEYRRYLERPELLRQELLQNQQSPRGQVVIDEIQRVPALLDEAHWLLENRGAHFALCGSSARKVKRGAANLLGGRVVRYELHGITARELGGEFDLDRLLNHGYLPRIYQASRPRRLLDSYVGDYLKEEVAAEGLVRNLPAFSEFLNAASLSDTEIVNFSNIARECGVSAHTVRSYFGILEDTLLGRWLPAYRRRPKRRVIGAPKFYFADVGVVNRLARRGELQPGSELYGKAFENWVFHELVAHVAYVNPDVALAYWRLASGIEVDFVANDMETAIEAKASQKITSDQLRGLRNLLQDHGGVRRRIVVSLEKRPRRTDDGIEILPAATFVERLAGGDIL